MSRRDFIDSVIMQAENPDEFSEILSNHYLMKKVCYIEAEHWEISPMP